MITTTERDLRRLDSLIAEHVMGWAFQTLRTGDYWVKSNGDRTIWAGHWAPTISWDGTGQVVERMRELGWTMNLNVLAGDSLKPCECRFFHIDSRWAMQTAESAPLAICLAALRALGVEET